MSQALRLDRTSSVSARAFGHHRNCDEPRHAITERIDPLLLPLLRAQTVAAAEETLARLIEEHARPTILAIIKRKLRVSLAATDGRRENQDALEICCEIQIDLLSALRLLQTQRRPAINNFQSYIAVIAFNACHNYLRQRYPRRHRLKNRLRYLLTHRADFSLWERAGVLVCGLTRWRFQQITFFGEEELRQLADELNSKGRLEATGGNWSALPLADLVSELLQQAGGPIEVDALVGVIANLCGIEEEREQTWKEETDSASDAFLEALPERRVNQALEVESKIYLKQLWSEICSLPSRQRAALLLNLRDSQSSCGGAAVISLFHLTGIATFGQMARALEMSDRELAGLWNELPLADAVIAENLKITRQQVINLRKSARERLARRMNLLRPCAA